MEGMKRGKQGRFVNPYTQEPPRGLAQLVKWVCGKYREPAPMPDMPPGFEYPNREARLSMALPTASWVGHSTFLVSVGNVNILTDPIWSQCCSPLSRVGPNRLEAPPFPIKDLPRIHYILISHNHYDHLDLPTVLQLAARFPLATWLVPLRLRRWFARIGVRRVVELDWGGEHRETLRNPLQGTIAFTAVPAQHSSSRRGTTDRDKTGWCGWIVERHELSGPVKKFYYAGDTGYNDVQFKEIGRRFTPIDLSLLPIGAYLPKGFMHPVHVSPEESVIIHQEVGSRLSLAGHWRTFRLSEEPVMRPPFDLAVAMQRAGLSWEEFRVLWPGQCICWGPGSEELD